MRTTLPAFVGSILAAPLMFAGDGGGFAVEAARWLASDGGKDHQYGTGLAIEGSLALVGAPFGVDNGVKSGTVYVIDVPTGAEIRKLVADDAREYDVFGISAAIQGSSILVGARGQDTNGPNAGAAYLFDATTGQQTTKLLPADPAASDYFGVRVALEGNVAVVSAPLKDDNGQSSGAVYLFDVTTGQQTHKLLPADGAQQDSFGASLAIDGTTLVVGAPFDDDNGTDSGSAYVFDTVTGLELAKLVPTDGGADDRFGTSVGISGSTIVVGANFDDDNGGNSGSAYLFDAVTGQETAKLHPGDAMPNDNFGIAVGIAGSTIVVGAHGKADNGDASGAAYLFDAGTGEEIVKLLASDGAFADWLGAYVAIDASNALVGASFSDHQGDFSGSAYRFALPGPIGTSYCGPAVVNSSGQSARIAANGLPSATGNCVCLKATDMPPGQFGMFLNSLSEGFVQPPGAQGFLCLSGGIGFYTSGVMRTGPAGAFSIQLDLPNTPTPGGTVAIQPGETWRFQAWFRDQNPGTTSNFTDGVRIAFQ